jgi:catechol 2,3-dioxygenase-like lactoylglutathione lyase family enzyme
MAITPGGPNWFRLIRRKHRGSFSVITGLDHVVILIGDIKQGAAAYQALLGRAPSWQYSGDGADRVLFTLDNITVELVAPGGEGEAADRIRAVLVEQGEGLASLCFRTDDIAKLHRRLDRLTLKPEPVSDVASRDTVSGHSLSWKRTRTATSATRGVRLFFLQLANERPHSKVTTDAPITSMDHVVVSTSDPERAAALYGARLGLDMALDRSHPEWGRLMFFRCGDLIVEVAYRPGKEAEGAMDRLHGISWRIANADATRARLLAAGLDVSEVRTGRRPGTRVMTVKSGTCGVPTLLLEKSAKPE